MKHESKYRNDSIVNNDDNFNDCIIESLPGCSSCINCLLFSVAWQELQDVLLHAERIMVVLAYSYVCKNCTVNNHNEKLYL